MCKYVYMTNINSLCQHSDGKGSVKAGEGLGANCFVLENGEHLVNACRR